VLHDHHEAQDTAQDAFLAAWQGLAGFRSDCEFGTWLHPIVTRRAPE
jgi:RNA polymerase sigma-70 factor (ECF subfamily)